MSLALKFTSLAVRTLSKPIANFIKRQAREHEGFRKTCISFAQSLHRVDMRWRIGLLQDSAALEKQAQKDGAAAASKKKSSVPDVPPVPEVKGQEEAAKAARETRKNRPQPYIRPLSEAKAIETGANFISETFLFAVGAGLILFESWRSGRKESARREDVKDRLNDLEESEQAARRALIELEREVLRLRARELNAKASTLPRILSPDVYEERTEERDEPRGWFSRVSSIFSNGDLDQQAAKDALDGKMVGPASKILSDSDRAIEEKHKRQAAEEAARVAQGQQVSAKAA